MAKAVFENGKVVLGEEVDWENGVRLLVIPKSEWKNDARENASAPRGNGGAWPETPHELETFLKEMDELGPLMNEHAAVEWEHQIKEQRRENADSFEERAVKVEKLFS